MQNQDVVTKQEFTEFTEFTKSVDDRFKEMDGKISTIQIEVAEIKKDILHLTNKIDSIANVRSWIIAVAASIGALTGIVSMLKLFMSP
ncbi:MAG: hypothetical protein OXM61_13530 [Candidatus Poribacteria bacterium]|nr:hypothetical protein [Candidatus Poribacteria bacterium]